MIWVCPKCNHFVDENRCPRCHIYKGYSVDFPTPAELNDEAIRTSDNSQLTVIREFSEKEKDTIEQIQGELVWLRKKLEKHIAYRKKGDRL